jgi:uncharacterized integral membrane protein
MFLFLIVALLVSIMTGIFALQNAMPITVNFLTWTFEGSLALVLLSTFALGVLTSLLVLAPAMIRRRWDASHQNKKIADLETQLEERTASQRTSPGS